MNICICVHIYIYMYVEYMCTYVCIYIYMYIHTWKYRLYIYIYLCFVWNSSGPQFLSRSPSTNFHRTDQICQCVKSKFIPRNWVLTDSSNGVQRYRAKFFSTQFSADNLKWAVSNRVQVEGKNQVSYLLVSSNITGIFLPFRGVMVSHQHWDLPTGHVYRFRHRKNLDV